MEAYQFHECPNIDPLTKTKIKIGDKRYLELVNLYGEPPKIKSPLTQRKIAVNKIEYKRLIAKGYTDDQLLYPSLSSSILQPIKTDIKADKNLNMDMDVETNVEIKINNEEVDIDDVINQMTNMAINDDNVYPGHLCTYILTDKLHCLGKSLPLDSLAPPITCCPSMLNLYMYNKDGLFVMNETGFKKLDFHHPVKCMKYSFGYVFIQTQNHDLYIYHDYEQQFLPQILHNIALISSCYDHLLLYVDNRVYVVPHMHYTNIDLDDMDSYKIKDAIKLSASKRGDLILTPRYLYGIKDAEKWLLNVDDVIDISSNDYVDMVLTKTELYGFGDNSHGQLGQGNKNEYEGLVKIPIPNGTKRVYCGRHNTIVYNGQYYGVGDNTNNCLGLNNVFNVPEVLTLTKMMF